MNELLEIRDGLHVYNAGLPRFPRNFTRDGIIAGLLFEDGTMLRDQVLFSALHQGQQIDPLTGEEPGKIFHEFPGFPLRDRNTQFNGCDTTGLWLYGLATAATLLDDDGLVAQLRPQIEAAIGYVRRHLTTDYLLEEAPSYADADQFALKVTYWKDSVMLDRPDGTPAWPAVFTLAHIQTLAGVRAIGRKLNDPDLIQLAQNMLDALPLLWDGAAGNFYAARDRQGPIPSVTSDGLHALAYLERGDLPDEWVRAIAESSRVLETELGYVVMNPADAGRVDYDYHAKTIWPFEQGMIHRGARVFGLDRVEMVAERVIPHIQDAAPETLATVPDLVSKSCDPQLWTLAARHYFDHIAHRHPFDWRVVASKYALKDRWIAVRTDDVQMPNGNIIEAFYSLEYPDYINVLALTPDEQVVMVRQYRHGPKRTLLELVSGTQDGDETPLETAKRELLEETGFSAETWIPLQPTSVNPATHANTVYNFLALDAVRIDEQSLDHSEQIEVVIMPLNDVLDLLKNGKIYYAVYRLMLFEFFEIFHKAPLNIT